MVLVHRGEERGSKLLLRMDVVRDLVLSRGLFKARQQSRVFALKQLRGHLQHPQLQLL